MADAGQLLRMTVRRSAGQVVLQLAGEADVAGEPRLRMRLDAVLSSGATDVVVDVAQLAFLDVRCLQVLLEAAGALEARGGRLVLRSPSRRVRRLLTVLDVHDRLVAR